MVVGKEESGKKELEEVGKCKEGGKGGKEEEEGGGGKIVMGYDL